MEWKALTGFAALLRSLAHIVQNWEATAPGFQAGAFAL